MTFRFFNAHSAAEQPQHGSVVPRPKIIWLTLQEHYTAQTLWASLLALGLMGFLAAGVAGAALKEAFRFLDTALYMLCDTTLFLLASTWGAGAYRKDFNPRGMAEILLPMGVTPVTLVKKRTLGFWALLTAACLTIFFVRYAALTMVKSQPPYPVHMWIGLFQMPLLSLCKAIIAFSMSYFMGIFLSQQISFLSTIFLFFAGFVFNGNQTFQQINTAAFAPGTPTSIALDQLSRLERLLLYAFKYWNPQVLVVPHIGGQWMPFAPIDMLGRVAWALALAGAFTCAAAWLSQRQNVEHT